MELPFSERTQRLPVTDLRKWQMYGDVLCICLLSIIVLLIASRLVDLTRLHYGYSEQHLNDQVGYISVARNFVENGTLSSNIIYPSTLYQDTTKNYLYMPGHYYALVASFALFGFGIIQSFLPNMVSFVLTSVCVFLIAGRVYNRRVGFISSILFMFFPINIIYAYTAMSEMTLVFASTLVFCIYIYLPSNMKLYLGPVLVLFPILFRETGVIISVPMSAMIFLNARRYNVAKTIAFLFVSFILFGIILKSDISSGRPSLLYANLFDGSFSTIYTDAAAQKAIMPSPLDWPIAILFNAWGNFIFIVGSIFLNLSFDIISVWVIFISMISALVFSIRRKERFSLASGLLALVTSAVIFSLYTFNAYRGLRVLLFTFPLLSISNAYIYERCILPSTISKRIRAHRLFRLAPITVISLVSLLTVNIMFARFSYFDALNVQHTNFLETLHHNDRKMLITPFPLSFDYIYRHHPVKWSFVPENPQTLELLSQKYDIGTIVMPCSTYKKSFTIEEFEKIGLSLVNIVTYEGEKYVVFKHS